MLQSSVCDAKRDLNLVLFLVKGISNKLRTNTLKMGFGESRGTTVMGPRWEYYTLRCNVVELVVGYRYC